MIKTVIILLGAFWFYACSQGSVDESFYMWVRQQCEKNEPCKIRMSDKTDFVWDKMYVFAPQVMEYEIKEVLGSSVHRSGEYANEVIFIKDGKVVHHFENIVNAEDKGRGSIIFTEIPVSKKYVVYEAGVVFDVKREKTIKGSNFLLSCSECAIAPE